MLVKAKEAYAIWFKFLNDFPKVYRGTLGAKIEHYFLELLECIFTCLYLPHERKAARLALAISKLDGVKFFLQLAWENRCLSDEQYARLSEKLLETGRILGGWKKGLEAKTPAQKREKQ